MMPRMDGFAMAREIRKASPAAPLLFLTAKNTVDDVEKGFGIGADDYLKKPFELRELIVRIKALLRLSAAAAAKTAFSASAHTHSTPPRRPSPSAARRHGCRTSSRAYSASSPPAWERTADASELMMAVWQRDDPSNRNSLHGYIHKLRRMLRHDPSVSIINQRGFGYMLVVKGMTAIFIINQALIGHYPSIWSITRPAARRL